jgi:hypothetical protein
MSMDTNNSGSDCHSKQDEDEKMNGVPFAICERFSFAPRVNAQASTCGRLAQESAGAL